MATIDVETSEPQLVSKTKAKSPVWNYFGFKPGPDGRPEDQSATICRVCKRSVAAKGGNTSNLFSHLKKQHPKTFAEVKAANNTEKDSSQASQSQQQPTITEVIGSA